MFGRASQTDSSDEDAFGGGNAPSMSSALWLHCCVVSRVNDSDGSVRRIGNQHHVLTQCAGKSLEVVSQQQSLYVGFSRRCESGLFSCFWQSLHIPCDVLSKVSSYLPNTVNRLRLLVVVKVTFLNPKLAGVRKFHRLLRSSADTEIVVVRDDQNIPPYFFQKQPLVNCINLYGIKSRAVESEGFST